MTQWPGPPMHDSPPPHAEPVAGVSCGMLTGTHSRTVLRAPDARRLTAQMRDWRCVCGRPCIGERTRPPAGPVAGRAEEHA